MSAKNILNLDTTGKFKIIYRLSNTKNIRFTATDKDGSPINQTSQYQFSVSEDANFDDILITLTNGSGLSVVDNVIEVAILIDKDLCSYGGKFFELKDVTNNLSIFVGEFEILKSLI